MEESAYHYNLHKQMQIADLCTGGCKGKSTSHACKIFAVHEVRFTVCLQSDVA